MQVRCIRCKGRGFCGRAFCPIYAKSQARYRVESSIAKEEFFGESPAPFVGRIGYPYINVGILSPPDHRENAWEYDAPRFWADQNYEIPKIIEFRSSLINSRFRTHVRTKHNFLDISQEVGMASEPVEMEIHLDKKPSFRISYDANTAPMGPSASIRTAKITSNPRIPRAVDKVVGDTDLKAQAALYYLYDRGFDENFLTKLLSVATLGVRPQRMLVPTRNSITAIDDALGKHLLATIRDYPPYDYAVHFGGYLGNYFLVISFPEVYSYELFEMYMPRAEWNVSDELQYTTDYEPYHGRRSYAENCAGGFYAARLGLLEKLAGIRRQASVLVIRVITGEYAVPLGVWVVREAMRKAVRSKPLIFSSTELMLRYVQVFVKKKFGFEIGSVLSRSILLKELKTQTKVTQFL